MSSCCRETSVHPSTFLGMVCASLLGVLPHRWLDETKLMHYAGF
jgi:hypothetical protein